MKHKFFLCALSAVCVMLPCVVACAPQEAAESLQAPSEWEEPLGQEHEAPPEIPEVQPEVITPPTVEEPKPQAVNYVLAKTAVNLRAGAGTSYSSRGQTQASTLYAYEDKTDGWYKTYYKNKVCYISASEQYTQLVSFPAASEKVEAVIAEGVKVLGTPYVYGATRYHNGKGAKLSGFSVNAFDCSSLMQYIFYTGSGALLDMNTRTQVKQGTAVKKSEIQRGDLLFFTNDSRKDNTGIERVGHVALYLGDNYILHTASDFAKIEQISTKRWSYFIEARRIDL